MKRITAEKLTEMGACEGDVRDFRKEWPADCMPTLRNIRRARELELDLDWYAEQTLSCDAYREFDAVRAGACSVWNDAWNAACDQYVEKSVHMAAMAKADEVYGLAVAKALYHALKTGAKK